MKTEDAALQRDDELSARRRAAQARLAAANRKFSEARSLAPTGDGDARQRAQEALVSARLAREELATIANEEREKISQGKR